MSSHNYQGISESEQMYLITIARLIEDGQSEPIPLADIAKEMSLLPVSVNQMVRKLEGEGLLHYSPYKGVELTDFGRRIAFRTLRNRRLWEVFLVDHLKVSLEEADTMACTMEHATPDDIAQRLANYLGDPASGPEGRPIPDPDSDELFQDWVSLTELEVGMSAQVADINAPPAVIRFLNEEGLRPGSKVTLRAIGTRDSRLIEVGSGYVELSVEIANSIQVSKVNLNQEISVERQNKETHIPPTSPPKKG